MIFSTVTTFIEQVGRRLTWRYSELDNMICIWTGPASGALGFKPSVNSPHPEYPLMFVTDAQILHEAAEIAEVSVTYVGVIQTKGQSPYYTEPVVTINPCQGSRDFIETFVVEDQPAEWAMVDDGSGGYTVVGHDATYAYGSQSICVRYIGAGVAVRYMAYPKPPAHAIHDSLGKASVYWEILSTTYGPRTYAAFGLSNYQANFQASQMGGGIPPLFAAFLGANANQRGRWWEVTETYGPTF